MSLHNEGRAEGILDTSKPTYIKLDPMGCKIDLKMELDASAPVEYAMIYLARGSQVRQKMGYWVRFPFTKSGGDYKETEFAARVEPGGSYQRVFKFRAKCGRKRRYRFHLRWKLPDNETLQTKTIYWPSASTYDESNTIDLGDLNEYIDYATT